LLDTTINDAYIIYYITKHKSNEIPKKFYNFKLELIHNLAKDYCSRKRKYSVVNDEITHEHERVKINGC